MENKIQVFSNKDFGEVRTIEDGKKVWFCAVDVAKMLGYADTAKSVKLHCKPDGWANYPVIDSMGRTQEARFLTEGNVWRLIVHSKLPKAQEVERWIMEEVLPTIRHTGSYSKPEVNQTYKYIPKTWRNRPVVTVEDISEATGISNKALIAGSDYFFLEGQDLAAFKVENPFISKMVPKLYLIAPGGIDKLSKIIRITVSLPVPDEVSKTPIENEESATSTLQKNQAIIDAMKRNVVDVPQNPEYIKLVEAIHKDMTALEIAIAHSNRYLSSENFEKIIYVIGQIGYDIADVTYHISKFQPKMVEIPM